MTLLEKMLPLEKEFFLWINENHTPFWDAFMYLYSTRVAWIPLLLVAVYVFVRKVERRESILLIMTIALIILLCDQISSSLIKPYFERLRPTHHPDFKNLVLTVYNYTGGYLGFVSSHAANGVGISIFLMSVIRDKWFRMSMLLWISVTCYSRIYLGVHFVSDVIGGVILGLLVGLLLSYLYRLFRKHIFHLSKNELYEPVIAPEKSKYLIYTILITILFLLIASGIIIQFFPNDVSDVFFDLKTRDLL